MNARLTLASIAVIAVVSLTACTSGSLADVPSSTATPSASPAADVVTPEPTPTSTPEPTATATPEPTATPDPTATPTPEPTGPVIVVVDKDTEFIEMVEGGDIIHGRADIKFKLTLKNEGDVASQATCRFTVSDSFSPIANSSLVDTETLTKTLKPVIKPGQTVKTTYTFPAAPVMVMGTNVSWHYNAVCEAAE